MARHISAFMAGYVDQQSVPDFCEWINLESRCEPSSHYEVIYGSSCSRWCYNENDAGRKTKRAGRNHQKKNNGGNSMARSGNGDDGYRVDGYGIVEVIASGGWGGGGCCCTQPSAGGGQGTYIKECKRLLPGYFACTVAAHYGC